MKGCGALKIESLKLSDLNPAKYNPRKELKPGDAEFEKLKRSIEQFGYVELIVVNEATGFTVISGHQRLSVLKALHGARRTLLRRYHKALGEFHRSQGRENWRIKI